jgi:hypothetical protein
LLGAVGYVDAIDPGKETMSADQSTAEHQKTITIIVNGRPKHVPGTTISFEDLVKLAFGDNPPSGSNVEITVTYSKGHDPHRQGSLLPGQSVPITNGMVFDVTATDKS